MSRTKTKRYLVLLAAVGLVAAALGGTGTFASFTAQTTNSGNTFATGTLLLSDTIGLGSPCHSESNALNAAVCPAAFAATGKGTSSSASSIVTIENTGTLNASSLTLAAGTGLPACVNSTSVTVTGGLTQNGDICGNLKLSVEEDTAVTSGTPVSCLVGTPSTGDPNACDPTQGTQLDTWLTGTQTTPVSLTGALAPSTPHHYKVTLYLGNVGNTFQGRQALFDLAWQLQG